VVWCKNLILEFRTKPEPGIIAETNNEKDRLDATEADNRAAADHTPCSGKSPLWSHNPAL
jgi:hypothetical protein